MHRPSHHRLRALAEQDDLRRQVRRALWVRRACLLLLVLLCATALSLTYLLLTDFYPHLDLLHLR